MNMTTKILALTLTQSFGATIWQPASNSLASASWDTFIFASSTSGDSGSQGAAQITTGTLVTGSELSTEITQAYDSPPGGFLGNPDTYYFHNGAANWTASVDLLSGISYVRVSYALLGFGGGAPDAYPNIPEVTGSTLINNGTYNTATNTVFFYDLQLDSAATSIETNFGDALFPSFPGSFRSFDSFQMEFFDSAPVPEPSSALLIALAGIPLLRRRRPILN